MATDPAEVVAGVIRATLTEDLDAAFAAAVAQGSHLALVEPGIEVSDERLGQVGLQLDADRGLASVSLVDRQGLATIELGPDGGPDLATSHTTTELDATLAQLALPPLSVPRPAGAVVVLSRHALSRLPALPRAELPAERLAAWSFEAGARALTHLADLHSVVDGRGRPGGTTPSIEPTSAVLGTRGDPALAHARLNLRVALRGMRVHVDGRTLEGPETGTEVHTVQLIRALATRPEIAYIGVNLRAGVPDYARAALASPRIHLIEGCGEWSPDLPTVDVFHRPYQPLSRADCDRWRTVGARTACHMQDLITYLSPQYHESVDDWRRWRTDVSQAVTSVDGVFTLSEYVRDQLLRERMRGEDDLVWSAPCGVDHMTGDADGPTSQQPPELAELRRPFALVLGSSYGHKNVDLAREAVDDARTAGCDLALVTAGRQVAAASGGMAAAAHELHLGRNVSSAERNWLLGNAAVVVFATSAEGFGLVPFEAAAYGSPTVCVSFGALAEHLGELPVETADWSVASFSRSIQEVVRDKAAGRAQVEAVRRAATHLTWDQTAGTVLRGYQEILRRPARG